jgi:hypothetical protein
MATGRILKKNIAKSSRISELSDSMALFYTWLIPFQDDFGLIWLSPKKLQWEIFCAREIFTIPYILQCLTSILKLELIKIVKIEDKYWIWFPDFTEKQTLKRDRKPQIYLNGQYNWKFLDKIHEFIVENINLEDIGNQMETNGKVREVNLREDKISSIPKNDSDFLSKIPDGNVKKNFLGGK